MIHEITSDDILNLEKSKVNEILKFIRRFMVP